MTASKNVVLKRNPDFAVRSGHPWVYRSQIQEIAPGAAPGDIVTVLDGRRPLGVGYYNPASEITVRLLARREVPIDAVFFKEKIKKAAAFRERTVADTNAWRVVSSEADDLPGLIVDRYGEILVVQFLTLGMERLRPLILEALNEVLSPRGIYERSDSSSRRIEGLAEKTGWIEKSCGDAVEVYEGSIRYNVHFEAGHKTGFYLDQRENRLLFAAMGIKGDVLDAFCYEGGFGLHLAKAGCRVLGVDVQDDVIRRAEENRRLNGLEAASLEFKTANVFDFLKASETEGRRFDFVILDPPSFVKKKSALEGALAGYKEILLRAMKLLNENGRLAVFSCSYHVDENRLMQASLAAAWDTHKSLRVLKFLKQSGDHPINPFIPETYYLKGYLFEVNS